MRNGFSLLSFRYSMPSKTAQLIAFFSVFLVSAGLHRFVYANLKRVILRDYPTLGARLVRAAAILFIVMDSPFIFLYFRNRMHVPLDTISQMLLYPFSVWQAIMLLWVVLLIPFALWRRRHVLGLARLQTRLGRRRKSAAGQATGLCHVDESRLEMVTE